MKVTQYALDVLENTLLDVIYHKHLSYFAVTPLDKFFAARGFQIIDVKRIAPKGGSIRVALQHAGGPRPVSAEVACLMQLEADRGILDQEIYDRFTDKITKLRSDIHDVIAQVQENGGTVAAYGSSVGCASLINQFDLGQKIGFIVDDNPFKTELVGPQYTLEVIHRDQLLVRQPDLIIVLAWRYAEAIAAKNDAYLHAGGRFLIPLPDISFRP